MAKLLLLVTVAAARAEANPVAYFRIRWQTCRFWSVRGLTLTASYVVLYDHLLSIWHELKYMTFAERMQQSST